MKRILCLVTLMIFLAFSLGYAGGLCHGSNDSSYSGLSGGWGSPFQTSYSRICHVWGSQTSFSGLCHVWDAPASSSGLCHVWDSPADSGPTELWDFSVDFDFWDPFFGW